MLHLLFGVVLGAFVLLQAVQTDSYEKDSQEQKDKTDSETGSEASISLPQTIPNSASHINLGFDSYLLDEVTFHENANTASKSSELVIPRVHKAIRVILKQIVSPNAP